VLVIIGVILGTISIFIFQPLGVFSYLNSSCASLGVSKLSERDLQQISDNPDYKNIMTLSDNDLEEVPKLAQLIDKVSNKISFNDESRFIVTISEMQQYYDHLGEKFEQQYGFEMEKKKDSLLIEYNGKMYVIAGFAFPKSGYDTENDVELVVVKDPMIKAAKIVLVDEDFVEIPKIKKAVEEIGTYQVSTFESIGMPEDERSQYGKWFEEKHKSKYGNTTGPYSYFKYGDKVYSAFSVIC
jgi:hypothetical protein